MSYNLKAGLLTTIFINIFFIAFAKLSLPAIFCNNMILQRQKTIVVWGECGAGQRITLSFNRRVYHCSSDSNGNWRVRLLSMEAGGPYKMIVETDAGEKLTIVNILIGEVWICAGQSNMNFILAADRNAPAELPFKNNRIREFRCGMPEGALNPENSEHSAWISATDENAKKHFSAVAYFFAKKLQSALSVPVGIVVMSCGATRAESWTNPVLLRADTMLRSLCHYWSVNITNSNSPLTAIPGRFYTDVIKPVAPFAARGLVWYQGESNTLPDNSGRSITERADEYKPLLKAVIESYRKAWQNSQWPVYLVQLPNYKDPSGDIQWAKIRQAQSDVAKGTIHTLLVVTIDAGDSANIHPDNKKPVGTRLANLALRNEYSVKYLYPVSSPSITHWKVKGAKVILQFKDMGQSHNRNSCLEGFEMADAVSPDNFIKANAILNNNRVIVRAPTIKTPAKVRYAWSDNPPVSLYNSAGLPASPFCVKISKN